MYPKKSHRDSYYKHFDNVAGEFLENGKVASCITMPPGSESYDHELDRVKYQSGYASSLGSKDSQEDTETAARFSCKMAGKRTDYQLFVVFDGHGGTSCSFDISKRLPKAIQRRAHSYGETMTQNVAEWNALKIGFVDANNASKNQPHGINGGSTGCVALLRDNRIILANAGDSRAVLVNAEGDVTQLTEDAKASDPRYQTSVEQRNGITEAPGDDTNNISTGKMLAPARGFGDGFLAGVTCRPKITVSDASDKERENSILILGSDGIFDCGTSEQVGTLA